MPLGANKAAIMGVAGVSAGASVVLLSSQTATGASSVAFTSDITSTYGEYIFKFYNVGPGTDTKALQVAFSTDGGSNYGLTKTTTNFYAYNKEDGSSPAITYQEGSDLEQGTGVVQLAHSLGSDADQSSAGEIHLFNPAGTTYVKHFYARTQSAMGDASGDYSTDTFVGGYINQTDDVDAVIFNFQTGVFDGKFKMWGVK